MKALADFFAAQRGNASRLAAGTGASVVFLRAIARGDRPCPPRLAVRIEKFTNGSLSRQQLFPDDYWELWPELASAGEGASA